MKIRFKIKIQNLMKIRFKIKIEIFQNYESLMKIKGQNQNWIWNHT